MPRPIGRGIRLSRLDPLSRARRPAQPDACSRRRARRPASGELASTASVRSSANGSPPKFVTTSHPPGRRYRSTSSPPGVDPLELSRRRAADRRSSRARRYSDSIDSGSSSCASTANRPNHSGCGRCAPSAPKPNDVPLRRPGQRHAASVPAHVEPRAAEVRRILPVGVVELGDLVQPELLALVQVGRAGQSEHEERRRARAPRARFAVERRARRRPRAATRCRACASGGRPRALRIGQAVARRVPHDVVVREHPRRRRAGLVPRARGCRRRCGGTARRRSPPRAGRS